MKATATTALSAARPTHSGHARKVAPILHLSGVPRHTTRKIQAAMCTENNRFFSLNDSATA